MQIVDAHPHIYSNTEVKDEKDVRQNVPEVIISAPTITLLAFEQDQNLVSGRYFQTKTASDGRVVV